MRPIISTAVTCLSIAAFSQVVDAQVSSNSDLTLEEVVVTAQKREERLQDVPISIAVLGGETLDRSTDRGVTEALSSVPGVFSSVTNRAGNGATAVISIRGVSAADVGPGTTAYYLDGTPFGTAQMAVVPDANPYDLDRIEVLRGPQGTLYGASALNGVVRVLTKAPNFQNFEFKARGSLQSTDHGSESYNGDAAFNLPLIQDKLAARIVLGYQDLGGWIDKPLLGKKDVNDLQKTNVRVKIAAKPTDNLTVGGTAWFSRTDSGGPPRTDDGGRSYSTKNIPGYVGFDEASSLDFDSYGLDVGYDASAVAIKSTTSYLDYRTQNTTDFTYSSPPYLPLANTTGPGGGSRVFTEEVVLNSVGTGPWRWTVGSMYRNAQDNSVGNTDPTDDPDDVYFVESKSWAAFGELTRLFADGRYELTGGLRYFRDRVLNQELSRSTAPIPGGRPIGSSVTNTFKKTTPRVVLTWHPSKDATLYASYSKGFRSGLAQGFSVADVAQQMLGTDLPAAKPDTLTNYEIGAKTTALGGKLNFETAVYYIDWQDPQQDSALFCTSPPASVCPTIPFVPTFINGKSLSGIGVDFAVMYAPVESLRLGLTASWNDLTYDQTITGSLTPVLFPKGSRRPDSPETTVGGNIAYTMKLSDSGYRGRLSASANYTSEQITGVGVLSGYLAKADAMTLVRGGFTVEAPKHWSAMLYVDNATDEVGLQPHAFTYPSPPLFPTTPAPGSGTMIRPRTYGLQLEYKY